MHYFIAIKAHTDFHADSIEEVHKIIKEKLKNTTIFYDDLDIEEFEEETDWEGL